jgi:hypothetical protein
MDMAVDQAWQYRVPGEIQNISPVSFFLTSIYYIREKPVAYLQNLVSFNGTAAAVNQPARQYKP